MCVMATVVVVVVVAGCDSQRASTKTIAEVWKKVGDCTALLTTEHQKLASSLDAIVDDLAKEQHSQHKALKALRADVKATHRAYSEMRYQSVPKAKATYYKKCEALDREPKDTPSSKHLKLAKEAAQADQTYRSAVQYLESTNEMLQAARRRALMEFERIEKKRLQSVKDAVVKYHQAENSVSVQRAKEMQSLKATIDSMKVELDVTLHRQEFEKAWPEQERVYYENYKTRTPAKNLVFGLPLEMAVRASPTGIPLPLTKCFSAIESRGITREGIYRLSGKLSDAVEVRLQLETDSEKIDLMEDKYDVHTLCSIVKQYLRELPQPIFPFCGKDRAEYSQIADEQERISRLQARVKMLPRPNQMVLREVITHLCK
eukprot:jgi/Hompol1/5917/HPOL_000308-RA